MPIIGLAGYARSGKDTIAEILVDLYGYRKLAFADNLREALLRLDPYIPEAGARLAELVTVLGWERSKVDYPEVRSLLQRMGTEVGREMFGENFWVDQTMSRIAREENVVLTDCRFPSEASAVRSAAGVLVRVVRPGFGPVNNHPSETSLDDAEFDAVIVNDGGLDVLARRVRSMLDKVSHHTHECVQKPLVESQQP